MIRRVFIKGYKSLKNVDLKLSPLTVIMGPNASGKSNLLDALGLLSRMVTGPTIASAFDEHRGPPLESFHVARGGVEELMKKETLRLSLGVEVELSKPARQCTEKRIQDMRGELPGAESNGRRAGSARIRECFLRYEIEIEFHTSTGQLRVVSERLAAVTEDGKPSRSRKPFLDRDYDNHRLVLRMEGQAHPIYHELGLDHSILSTPLSPPHYPHAAAFKEELSRWRFYDLDPAAMRKDTALSAVRYLRADGAGLSGYFHTLKNDSPKEFVAATRALRMVVPAAQTIDTEITPDGLIRLIYQDNDTRFSARVISDGTLRALALHAIVGRSNGLSTIGLEEPENSVHPVRLSLVASLLDAAAFNPLVSRKQFIVTTHSPHLARNLNPDCFSENYDSHAFLVWCRKDAGETKFQPMATSPILIDRDFDYAFEDALLRGDLGG